MWISEKRITMLDAYRGGRSLIAPSHGSGHPATPKLSHRQVFSKAIFAGCARNIARELENSLPDMYRLASEFDEYAIIVYENDSTDDTLTVLNNFSRNKRNVFIISESNVLGCRTERLARGRNALLNLAREKFPDYDLLVMMDMDYTRQNTKSLRQVAESMVGDWNAITAVSRQNYYDWWAFRARNLGLDYDCHNEEEKMNGNCDEWSIRTKHLRMNETFRRVESAFNGIAVYKFQQIPKDAKYVGLKNGKEICEHVMFHEKLPVIYIHPGIVTSTWDQ